MTGMIHAAKAGSVILLAITLSACATKLGRNFDEAYVPQIKPDETTKAEVRSRLGRPAMVQATGAHDRDVWTYAYYEGGGVSNTFMTWVRRTDPINPTGAQQKTLVIKFKGDLVQEATFVRQLPPPDPLEPEYR